MMHPDERNLIELTRRWERDRRSREAAGLPEPEPDETPAEALTRRELRRMLLRDRTKIQNQETE